MSSARPKVFVTREIPAEGLDRILASCAAEVWSEPLPPPREVLLKRVAGCHGVLSLLTDRIDAQVMDAAGAQLRVISNFAVGYNNVDLEAARKRGIRVGNTPDVLTQATADLAFALLIAAARRIVAGHDYVRAARWKTWEPLGHIGVDLEGRTLGIVGMGRIGAAMARRCRRGWGMRVLYASRHHKPQLEAELGAERVEFEALLEHSDFVSVHADLNAGTRGMFGDRAFDRMKQTAVFINTARGAIHDAGALDRALASGKIFAAALDVTDPEPICMDDPLLTRPNCLIVPHIGSATIRSRNGMARIAAENLLAGVRGEPLPCPVEETTQGGETRQGAG